MHGATQALVDLSAIRDNIEAIRRQVGPHRKIIPAVKADAYGHGAVDVSRECVAAGADALGVASVDEAVELRNAGIESEILILGCQPLEAAPEIVRWNVAATVCDPSFAASLSEAAVQQHRDAVVHIKVDTGMGRIGIDPRGGVEFARSVEALPNIRIGGVCTHFASADVPDVEFTRTQLEEFKRVVDELRSVLGNQFTAHAANSGAILAFPESYLDGVRPGILVYGVYPSRTVTRSIEVREALTLKSKIVFLKKGDCGCSVSYGRTHVLKRDSIVATLPIGYADGYSRRLSNAGEAVVRETRVPVIGRVCMDQTMIDVTDVPDVQTGDEVILYGGGYECLSVSSIAEKLDTIPYEVLCAIGKRVPRAYVGDGSDVSEFRD